VAALGLPQPPQLLDALGAGQGAAPQCGEGATHIVLAGSDLPGELSRVQRSAAGDLAGLVELLDALQRPPRRPGVFGLGSAAAGIGGMQRVELLGGWVAMADRLGAQIAQARVAQAAGAQGVQPLAGDRGGGADLGCQFGRIEWLAVGQLPGQVGVGDPVPDQPAAQLRQLWVALAVGAQHPHQVTGEPRRHADLTGQRGRIDRVAGVDLAGKPGVGDPLPGRPRISGPLLLRGRDAGGVLVEGHRRPPSRSGQTTRAAAARPCARSWRRWMRLKARSVLRPRRRSALSARRVARSSARWRRACSRGS
jgi:hypothetical protein